MYLKSTLFFMLIALSNNLEAKIYKWIDENGVFHYSEKKPEDIEHKEIKIGTEASKLVDQITQADIDGQWLVDEGIFLPSSYGVTVIWEFKDGNSSVIKDGKRIESGQYELSGHSIVSGELEIEILSVSKNSLKAEMYGQEFIMKRK